MKKIGIALLCIFSAVSHAAANYNTALIFNAGINQAELARELEALSKISLSPTRLYSFTTISRSGFYRLAQNVSNQITITASDVTLDLGGHTVSGGTYGIVVNSDLSNVTITNGAINSVTLDGIQVNSNCSDITISNVVTKQASCGMSFDQVSNGCIRNCEMNINTTGLELDLCHNILLEKCTANANKQAGFSLLSSTTCSLFDCKAISSGTQNINQSGDSSNVFGFVTSSGYGNIFNNCMANSTQNLSATNYSSVIAGFGLRGSESCTQILHCQAGNATTSPNGQSVPYGIWLEPSLNVTQLQTVNPGTRTFNVKWSPDSKYFAVVTNTQGGDEFAVYSYDRITNKIILLDSANTGQALDVQWRQDGKFLALQAGGLLIYEFDPITQSISQVFSTTGTTIGLSWSFDGKYIVGGGSTIVGVYEFDPIVKTANFVNSFSTGGNQIEATVWHPSEYIFATGYGDFTSPSVEIYRFDPGSGAIIFVTDDSSQTGSEIAQTLNWRHDGKYLATGGGGGTIIILLFENDTLTNVASVSYGAQIEEVAWSPDGRYIAAMGRNGNEFQIFEFDSTAGNLTQIESINVGATSNIGDDVHWSPDGEYIAIACNTPDPVQIYSGFSFPSKNVIKNNKLFCNSGNNCPGGVGISGSSFANMIIENNAFDNPANYYFCTNVFNQLFDFQPTALQNISASSTNPICTPDDIIARSKRVNLLLESLIDNLL